MSTGELTLERAAEACYERYQIVRGDQTSPDWGRLTIKERENWRQVVLTAWSVR